MIKRGNINLKKGQVTIFIIIAILIIAAVALFLVLRGDVLEPQIPASIEPVYNDFLSCLRTETLTGISLLESQGGYISLPEFEPGSSYMPFSSQLNFLGNPIPYWYYVSGNNIEKEQVPSENEMEEQLGGFIEDRIRGCELDEYYEKGFQINQEEPEVNVDIRGREVLVDMDMQMSINSGNDTAVIDNHDVVVNSELGELYDAARGVYEYEQNNLFLENYGLDVLRLYAPVDGVELTCSPRIWNADSVFDDLENALENNVMALKGSGGGYYSVDLPVDKNVRFINSQEWPSTFEVSPSEGNILMAEPVGNQQGLGILGFCYAPYHFIYDVKYPVLVQVSGESGETFQFPMSVIIENNQPREALNGSAIHTSEPELCQYKNTEVNVQTQNVNLNPIDANISYECFGEVCRIGETQGGVLQGNFPQCVNGAVVASAKGYEDARESLSTTENTGVSIVLDRLYEGQVELNVDGSSYNKSAVISFVSNDTSETLVYPEQNIVELSEGDYEIQVQIYEEANVEFGNVRKEQCVEVSQSGIRGMLGLTKEECFDINVPEGITSNALSGGGTENYYITESELKNSQTIEVNVKSLPSPNTIEQLQSNYVLFENRGVDLVFS